MKEIPAEVYQEIVSCFHSRSSWVYPPRRGARIVDSLGDYARFADLNLDLLDLQTLFALRLTDKSFHHAATSLLVRFNQFKWIPFCGCSTTSDILGTCENHKEQGSISKNITTSVKLLKIRLTNRGLYQPQACEGEDQTIDAQQLPQTLEKFTEIKSFEFRFPRIQWQTEEQNLRFGGRMHPNIRLLDVQNIDTIVSLLGNSFKTIPAFQNISDLRLELLGTKSYQDLGSCFSDEFLAQLRHLYLGVTDESGPRGSRREYIQDWDGESEIPDDGTQYRSALQTKYPNRQYSESIFQIVNRCPNLQNLGICGSHPLNGEAFQSPLPSSSSLKSLFLSRVHISASKLIGILSTNTTSNADVGTDTPTSFILEKLCLENMELTAGKWVDVFDRLTKIQSLVYLNPSNLTYTFTGSSADRRGYWNRPWEDSGPIYTKEYSETRALGSFMKLLVDRAGGPNNYPNDRYEQDILDEM